MPCASVRHAMRTRCASRNEQTMRARVVELVFKIQLFKRQREVHDAHVVLLFHVLLVNFFFFFEENYCDFGWKADLNLKILVFWCYSREVRTRITQRISHAHAVFFKWTMRVLLIAASFLIWYSSMQDFFSCWSLIRGYWRERTQCWMRRLVRCEYNHGGVNLRKKVSRGPGGGFFAGSLLVREVRIWPANQQERLKSNCYSCLLYARRFLFFCTVHVISSCELVKLELKKSISPRKCETRWPC